MPDNQLFRQEAIDHQKAKWAGRALLTSGFPAWIVACTCMSTICVLVVFLIAGTYTQRISVPAEVITQPHTIQMFSQQQGIIHKQFVDAPSLVNKGDRIYQIDVSRVTRSGNVSASAVVAIEAQMTQIDNMMAKLEDDRQSTLANLNTQLAQYTGTLKESEKQLENTRRAMETTRRTMENYEEYLRQGLVTKEQVSNHRAQFYQQQSAYQSLTTQVNQQGMEMTKLRSDIATRGISFENQLSQYKNQRSELQKQLAEADATGTLFVDSPVDGRLAAAAVTTGQMVNAGDLLAQIVPTADYSYQLVLWLPNSGVPYVSVNDKVKIRYDAFPFEKFGQFSGRIMSLANVPSTAQEMSNYTNAPRDGQPYYKAIAHLDNDKFTYKQKALLLSSGMKAQVTLFLEERPLYQWMLSPFYDIGKGMVGNK